LVTNPYRNPTINISGNPTAGRVGGGVQEEEEDAGKHVGRRMLNTEPIERKLFQYAKNLCRGQ
jgi:hypothetical protein